jgi:hypothetical protein
MNKKHVIGYGATAVVALGVGAAGGSGDNGTQVSASDSGAKPAVTVTTTTTATETVPPSPAPAKTIFKTVTSTPAPVSAIEEGVWEVGVDVKPGTYKVTAALSEECYWKIAKIGSDDIIQNDIPTGGRPVVKLSKGQEFTNQGCGTWGKVK